MGKDLDFRRIVLERCRDDVAVKLVVPVSPEAERPAYGVEDAAHVAAFTTDVEDLTARVEIRLAFFNQRNPVMRFVVRETAAEIAFVRRVGETDFAKPRAIERIRHLAIG